MTVASLKRELVQFQEDRLKQIWVIQRETCEGMELPAPLRPYNVVLSVYREYCIIHHSLFIDTNLQTTYNHKLVFVLSCGAAVRENVRLF